MSVFFKLRFSFSIFLWDKLFLTRRYKAVVFQPYSWKNSLYRTFFRLSPITWNGGPHLQQSISSVFQEDTSNMKYLSIAKILCNSRLPRQQSQKHNPTTMSAIFCRANKPFLTEM